MKNKSTVLGIVLIGVILLVFSWYNNKVYKEQQERHSQQQESAEKSDIGDALETDKKPDSLSDSVVSNDRIYKDTLLALAASGDIPEEISFLENDKIKVGFTNLGAQAKSVNIKGYSASDASELVLFKDDQSKFSLNFFTNQQLSTTAFAFKKEGGTDTTLQYRLYIDSTSYIKYLYILPKDSYMLKLNISFVGMDKHIRKNTSSVDLAWSVDMRRQEQGYSNEKSYSTVSYKYPNDDNVDNLGLRQDTAEKDLRVKVEWVGFQAQFFSAIMVAPESFTNGDLSYSFYPENDSDGRLMNCNAKMTMPYKSSGEEVMPVEFYYGPNLYNALNEYDRSFEKIIPMGGWLIGWINRYIIVVVFDLLSRFISNYGIIILLLTIIIKVVLSPLTFKSYLSSAKMRVLKPEIEKINAKYSGKQEAMKKQQEIMALYRKTGVNMFGGCLPMLLQFPILFAMFRFFPVSFELRQESFLWAKDLSNYDSIFNLPFSIPLYGDHVSLFALLMAISTFFYAKMTMSQMDTGNSQMMPGMKFMQLYFMPIFLLVFCNNLSSGLSYYYMLSNLFTIGQTWFVRKFMVNEEKLYRQLQEKAANSSVKKSKFQQRLEEAYKQQQLKQKQSKR